MVRTQTVGLILMVMTTACSYNVSVPETPAATFKVAESGWIAVLQHYVDDQGRVDFIGLAASPGDLHAYVAFIARYSPDSHPEMFGTADERLAYHINAYNALSMYNVLEAGIPKSLTGYGKVNFFYFRKVTVGGRKISLYAYENNIIRPIGDERVHFALNCMSVGCPRLPQEPFQADGLDDQLNRETRRFLAEYRYLQVDRDKGILRLSEIFRFYRKDFTQKSGSLVAYINRYRDEPIPEDFRVEFIPYDWTVNIQP